MPAGLGSRTLERTVDLARGLDAEILATHVTTAEELAAVRERGIRLVQGPYLGGIQ